MRQRHSPDSRAPDQFWKQHWRGFLVLLFAPVLLALGTEIVCTVMEARVARAQKDRPWQFQRLFLAHLLYPQLATSQFESGMGIREYPGDDQEEYNAALAFRADPLLSWKPRENSAIVRFSHPILVNSQSFVSITDRRDFVVSREKSPGTYRVIVVGGSTVYGIGAFPWESIPAQIERLANGGNVKSNSFGGRHVEVINAGVGGYTSAQELVYLMSELVTYRPDLVIVYDGWNDVHFQNLRAWKLGERWVPLRSYQCDVQAGELDTSFNPGKVVSMWANSMFLVARHVALMVWDGSAAVRALRSRLERTPMSGLVSSAQRWLNYYDETASDKRPYDPRVGESYRHHLELMSELARYHGFRIAFFLQPFMGPSAKPFTSDERSHFASLGAEDLANRIAFGKHASKIFAELRRKFRPRADMFAEDLTQIFRDTVIRTFYFTGHLNGDGNRIVATRIVSSLREKGWLP